MKPIFSAFLPLFIAATFLATAPLMASEPSHPSRTIRHLGVPYANFITGLGDGFSIELIKGFAASIGAEYRFVPSTWQNLVGDLIGKRLEVSGCNASIIGDAPVRGDLIASGLTRLPWRSRLLLYSDPVFPTQIWVVAPAESPLRPIEPSNNEREDVAATKGLLKGLKVLGKKGTCLDGSLYGLEEVGARFMDFKGSVNELVPALLTGMGDVTLLDVPDALVALDKWPGRIKVIGPVSPRQVMGVAFPKREARLRDEFNTYLRKIKKNGTYYQLVKKYYPVVFHFFPDFFNDVKKGHE